MKHKIRHLFVFWAAVLFMFFGSIAKTSCANPIWIPDWKDFTGETEDLLTEAETEEMEPKDPAEAMELYQMGLILFEEEKYYSAWEAFTESGYGDWEDRAAACVQPNPETGELWHAESELPEDMEIQFVARQSDTSNLIIRVYKEEDLVSSVYIAGPGEVKITLPGDTEYIIKDAVGEIWYGEEEAFGRDGYYETLFLNHEGKEAYLFQSGYIHTITISFEDVDYEDPYGRERTEWDNF